MNEVNELNMNTDWNNILELIKDNKFEIKYSNYIFHLRESGYLIMEKESKNKDKNEGVKEVEKEEKIYKDVDEKIDGKKDADDKTDKNNKIKRKKFFLFEEKKKIKIYFSSNEFETIEVFTSLEIETFIKGKNKNINHLYIKNSEKDKFVDSIGSLGFILEYYDLEFREKEPLPDLILKNSLSLSKDYSPEQYSKYFYEYFKYEDKQKKNDEIKFQKNKMRSIIFNNIVSQLRDKKELKTFKFTGPSSIGKSFTLFRLSHICYNIAYINVKVLEEHIKDLYTTYSIIISELERFNIKECLEDIKNIINNNYNADNSYLNLLLNIMECLKNIDVNFVFIFDQFKYKYFPKNFMEKLKIFDNIKIVQCSSINDKNIRQECLKTWFIVGKNILYLDKNNQDYYLYFERFYFSENNMNNDSKNIVFKQFDYMPKYINKYKDYQDKNSIYDDTKKCIKAKIDDFCESHKIDNSLLYSKLKYITNKDYDYNNFEDIIKYCPLKYYVHQIP